MTERHISTPQEKRNALAARVTSQVVQLKALNGSIRKLHAQETRYAQHSPWQEGQSHDSATIDIIPELGHVSQHIGNAIEQLEGLTHLLDATGQDDE